MKHFVYKSRVQTGLLTELCYQANQVEEASEYVEKLFDGSIEAGSEIKHSAHYTPENYEYFKSITCDLPIYLSKNKLSKTIKFYKALEEFDTLVDGLMKDLTILKSEKKKITQEDMDFLKRKRDRIVALKKIICSSKLISLNDLPDDYRDRLKPPTIIMR